jgi:hypothetical protein
MVALPGRHSVTANPSPLAPVQCPILADFTPRDNRCPIGLAFRGQAVHKARCQTVNYIHYTALDSSAGGAMALKHRATMKAVHLIFHRIQNRAFNGPRPSAWHQTH